MTQLLNTLYVQTQGSYLHLDHDTLKIDVEGKTAVQLPLHHFGGIVALGNVLISPFFLHRCAEDGRDIVWLTRSGRFRARLTSATKGNVLLRRAQHKALDDHGATLEIARRMLAGKLRNARTVLLRAAREAMSQDAQSALQHAAREHASAVEALPRVRHLDELRGVEGEAASRYFGAFNDMIRSDHEHFGFANRNRRPPRDPVNALLSFTYGMLRNECASALESVGLDPQIGYLHALRPGRAALALDLMEELRAPLADRFVLTVINRGQVHPDGFVARPGGAVEMTDDTRKAVVIAYQKRKYDEIRHPTLDKTIPIGLIPHAQARLLARHLRGDTPEYQPFLHR